jgi:alpha-beta hydrolase superfamily lysophospholipase
MAGGEFGNKYLSSYSKIFAMNNYKDSTIKSFDGLNLNLRFYDSVVKTDKILLITHGYGEHQGYYEDMAAYFAANGFNVLSYDLRSHGRSEGRRGDVPKFQYFIDDLTFIIGQMKNQYPYSDFFLLGHSLGGNIIINYLLINSDPHIKKAIATSPWLRLAFEPPLIKKIMAKIGLALFPSLVIKGELNIKNLSRNQQFIKSFESDPLNYDLISSRYYKEIIDAGEYTLANAEKLSTPLLVCHGDNDNITSYGTSKLFAEKSGAIFKSWNGGYKHVIFSEENRDEIFNYFLKYLSGI